MTNCLLALSEGQRIHGTYQSYIPAGDTEDEVGDPPVTNLMEGEPDLLATHVHIIQVEEDRCWERRVLEDKEQDVDAAGVPFRHDSN